MQSDIPRPTIETLGPTTISGPPPETSGHRFRDVTSPAGRALLKALAAACADIKPPAKTETADAGKYRYRYADLAGCLAAARPALRAHGLNVIQSPAWDAEHREVTVTTIVTHIDGGTFETALSLPIAQKDAQGIGSAITYARRYALLAVLGLAAEDDDGAAAVPPERHPWVVRLAQRLPLIAELWELDDLQETLEGASREQLPEPALMAGLQLIQEHRAKLTAKGAPSERPNQQRNEENQVKRDRAVDAAPSAGDRKEPLSARS